MPIFARRNYNAIAARINRDIEDLQAVVVSSQADADKVNAQIAALVAKRQTINAAAQNAATLSANLRSLLGAV